MRIQLFRIGSLLKRSRDDDDLAAFSSASSLSPSISLEQISHPAPAAADLRIRLRSDAGDFAASAEAVGRSAVELPLMMGPTAAAQLGALAALVVLFVPMGMAGRHLSRNKVLFFGGALFISLAVGVHLAPYFPSLSLVLLSSLHSVNTLQPQFQPRYDRTSTLSCLPYLHELDWSRGEADLSWNWAHSSQPAASCGFQKLLRSDASQLLNGTWILVAGDSQARLLTLSLLHLLLDPDAVPAVEADLFRRHSDYQATLPESGITIDFVWSPFEANLSSVLRDLRGKSNYPDVLVLGSGLWHMLHVTNSSSYGESLGGLGREAAALLSQGGSTQPLHMFWLGLPALVNSMLNTEEKKERMNLGMWEEYDRQMSKSLITQTSGGPFLLLDMGSLSRGCGQRCTADGMHYDSTVYEAALQVMLNALLIESQQQL